MVDAEPLSLVGRILRACARLQCDAVPEGDLRLDVGRRVLERRGERAPHRALPAPGLVAVPVDLMLNVALGPLRFRGRGLRGRLGRRVRANRRRAGKRHPKDAGACERECELWMHLGDPPGSTPPRDCAAARDSWLSRVRLPRKSRS